MCKNKVRYDYFPSFRSNNLLGRFPFLSENKCLIIIDEAIFFERFADENGRSNLLHVLLCINVWKAPKRSGLLINEVELLFAFTN